MTPVQVSQHEAVSKSIEDLKTELRSAILEWQGLPPSIALRRISSVRRLLRRRHDTFLKAYEQCGQNKSMTALVLGIDRRTLYRKLASYEEQDRREA